MQKNTTGWVIGTIVVVVLVGLGFWWAQNSSAPAGGNNTASSTTSGIPPVTVIDRSSASVDAIVGSLADASKFYSIFVNTGVAGQLTGKGPYTVFVPTNEAFGFLPPTEISSMTTAQLTQLVEHHVVSGKALNVDAISSGSAQTLNKDTVNFQVNVAAGTASVGGGNVLNEYKASNGVVYLISGVLIAPQPATQ